MNGVIDSWDARAYDRVSPDVQVAWGRKVLERRRWNGNETVVDAGAGSGGLTRILAGKVPDGRVYAVDLDPGMVSQARRNLSDCKNVQVIQSSMDSVAGVPAGKVDTIFSNSALHWLLDHRKAFSHFWQLLKPGGELLIQCGGRGNLDGEISVIHEIMQTDQFRGYFAGWKQSWHFPEPGETEGLLCETGFKDARAYLSQENTAFPDRGSYSLFVRTVIMKPFFAYLPGDGPRGRFLGAYLDKVAGRSENGWSLDYVRLNITARK